jgi:hypothetical protein
MVAPDKKGSSTDASELQTPQEVEEDEPTETCASIVFGWNDVGLEEFHNKAVAYALQPEAVLLPPPPQINGGVNLVGAGNCASIQQLKVWILEYLRAAQQQISTNNNPPPVIVGETACLACSQNQAMHVAVHVTELQYKPWFAAVLAHDGQPLAQPLGSLWHPRPRDISGMLDPLHVPGVLWA